MSLFLISLLSTFPLIKNISTVSSFYINLLSKKHFLSLCLLVLDLGNVSMRLWTRYSIFEKCEFLKNIIMPLLTFYYKRVNRCICWFPENCRKESESLQKGASVLWTEAHLFGTEVSVTCNLTNYFDIKSWMLLI